MGCFLLRNKYLYWHRDLKTDEDIIREEDIQIIRDWRSLGNGGFGLEDIEGLRNLKGFPWWKFKQSSRLRILGQWDKFLAPTPNQRAILSWILEQNWTKVQLAQANSIVE